MKAILIGIGQWIMGLYMVSVCIMYLYYSWLFIKQSFAHLLLFFLYGWIVATFKAIFWPIVEFLL